jgi:hypothetical protein
VAKFSRLLNGTMPVQLGETWTDGEHGHTDSVGAFVGGHGAVKRSKDKNA